MRKANDVIPYLRDSVCLSGSRLKSIRKISAALLLLLMVHGIKAQDLNAFERSMLIHGKDTLRYRMLLPLDYKAGKKYPVVLFLHGSGERGSDNSSQLTHGADLFLKPEVRSRFPAIILFPQCPSDSSWSYYNRAALHSSESDSMVFPFRRQPLLPQQMVKQLLDSLIDEGSADENRIYIGGLSMGGMGTYDLLMRYPDFFAAAFVMCGACNSKDFIARNVATPLWIFHGAKDDVVNPDYDRSLVTLMLKKNIRVKYTEYPDANHNCWDAAFAEPTLLPWLFSNHRQAHK